MKTTLDIFKRDRRYGEYVHTLVVELAIKDQTVLFRSSSRGPRGGVQTDGNFGVTKEEWDQIIEGVAMARILIERGETN